MKRVVAYYIYKRYASFLFDVKPYLFTSVLRLRKEVTCTAKKTMLDFFQPVPLQNPVTCKRT